MKTIIFSDTHLTDNVDHSRLQYLKKLIASVDQVIINGDLYDGYLVTFEKFVMSGWSELFPLLQSKTTYIFGNHDKKNFADNRVKLFSRKQDLKYEFKSGSQKILVEHGDRLSPSLDGMLPGLINRGNRFYPIWLKIEGDLSRSLPPVRWVLDAKRQLKNYRMAQRVKNWPKGQVLVAGHSHIPFATEHFFNPGKFCSRVARYVVIEGDSITLKEEKLN